MKRYLYRLIILLVVSSFFICCDKIDDGKMIIPQALNIGDTIAFCAPAAPLDTTRMILAKKRLIEMGFYVVQSESLFRRWGYLAGSDAMRADELMIFFQDPTIKAIFPGTGGYGTTRILDLLDYTIIRNNPKIFIGFSDITGLHIALNQIANLVTFHTPNPMYGLGSKGGLEPMAETYFWSLLKGNNEIYQIPFDLYEDSSQVEVIAPGKAQGCLVGGNLSLVCATMGSPYEIQTNGKLLFMEDIGEAPYRIDRYLRELKLAGKLDAVAGVILGRFTRRKEEPPDKPGDFTMDEVLDQYFKNLNVPVIKNFPAGHVRSNISLPLGVLAELDTEQGVLRFLESSTLNRDR